jgi:hypothetical protein
MHLFIKLKLGDKKGDKIGTNKLGGWKGETKG